MKWILTYQIPNDIVIFITDVAEQSRSMTYKEFLKFARPYVGINYEDFILNLDRFFTLFIDCEQKEWQIYRKESSNPSFEELLELNKEKKKDEFVKIYKNFFNKLVDKKHGRRPENTGREDLRSKLHRTGKW